MSPRGRREDRVRGGGNVGIATAATVAAAPCVAAAQRTSRLRPREQAERCSTAIICARRRGMRFCPMILSGLPRSHRGPDCGSPRTGRWIVPPMNFLHRTYLYGYHDRSRVSLPFSPRGEVKCVRGPSGRGASRLARARWPLKFFTNHESRVTKHESRSFYRVLRPSGGEKDRLISRVRRVGRERGVAVRFESPPKHGFYAFH